MTETRLRRLQWAVRATLVLGVAASVMANILHAQPNPISQAIAAWPPLALLITVELVTRIPVHRRALGAARIVATSAIAGIAAWVSYHHMVGVVARYGETGTVPYLLPVSVDGLIIVASVSLVDLAARRRDTDNQSATAPEASALPVPALPVTSARAPAASEPLAEPEQPESDASRAPAHPRRPSAGEPLDAHRLGEAPDGDDTKPADDSGDHEPDGDKDDTDTEPSEDHDQDGHDTTGDVYADLAPELMPLLPAARVARDELTREGHTVSRDALARRLRRNGHSIRNSGVSELLVALRREPTSVNGSRPTASV